MNGDVGQAGMLMLCQGYHDTYTLVRNKKSYTSGAEKPKAWEDRGRYGGRPEVCPPSDDLGFNPAAPHDSHLLLLTDTDRSSSSTCRASVLTTNTEAPVMSQTSAEGVSMEDRESCPSDRSLRSPLGSHDSLCSDLFQSLEILSQLVIQLIRQDLAVLAIDDILLSVKEPIRNLVLCRVLQDRYDPLQLVRGQFSPSLSQVDIGLFTDDVGVSSTDTSNGG